MIIGVLCEKGGTGKTTIAVRARKNFRLGSNYFANETELNCEWKILETELFYEWIGLNS
jgi:MoxR-like ATPase